MNRIDHKSKTSARRAHRVRSLTRGTTERPRLSVNVSNLHVSAQVIDDETSKTICAATTVGNKTATGTLSEKAVWVGEQIAKAAKAKKVTKVVFDRGAKQYHGRVKALADAARAAGLEF
jgi:large subunit ribosomal protein L18